MLSPEEIAAALVDLEDLPDAVIDPLAELLRLGAEIGDGPDAAARRAMLAELEADMARIMESDA